MKNWWRIKSNAYIIEAMWLYIEWSKCVYIHKKREKLIQKSSQTSLKFGHSCVWSVIISWEKSPCASSRNKLFCENRNQGCRSLSVYSARLASPEFLRKIGTNLVILCHTECPQSYAILRDIITKMHIYGKLQSYFALSKNSHILTISFKRQ